MLPWEFAARNPPDKQGVIADAEPCRRTHAPPPSATTQWAALPMIELRQTEIEVLVHRGYLKNETRNNERAVIEALYAHLENTLV